VASPFISADQLQPVRTTEPFVAYKVLGPVRLAHQTEPISGPRQRALLASFLLHANEPLSRERLAELLWEERQPASRDALTMHIGRLRKLLRASGGDFQLATLPHGYLLRVDHGELDVHVFEELAELGFEELGMNHPQGAAMTLRRALDLWRGRPYEDVNYTTRFHVEIERLEERRLTVLEARLDADLQLGHHSEVVHELQALVAQHGYREAFWELLLIALYRSGRQAEALRSYDQCRRSLLYHLGIEPGPRLRRLQQSILQQAPELESTHNARTPSSNVQSARVQRCSQHRWSCGRTSSDTHWTTHRSIDWRCGRRP
jgi:DNA-binding SARP family transcriptional activator